MIINIVRAAMIIVYSLYAGYAIQSTVKFIRGVRPPSGFAYMVVMNLFLAYTEAFWIIISRIGKDANFWTVYNTALFSMALYLLWKFHKGVDINIAREDHDERRQVSE